MTAPVVPLHVLGTDVDIQLGGEDPERLEEAVRSRWHLALRPGGGPAAERTVEACLVAEDAETAPRSRFEDAVHDSDERRLLQRLTQSVTYAAIGARTGQLLMLHAAGLAHPRTGATAVFVAPGNTGKTTLCRTLGPTRSYLTDETVGFGRDGYIDPYPKPLSTRRVDWVGVKDEQAPGDLGLTACLVRPWVAGIVLLDRQVEHEAEPLVEELDLLRAVASLIPESSAFMKTDGPLHWLADAVERTGGARRVTYAEVADLEPLTAEICGRESPW